MNNQIFIYNGSDICFQTEGEHVMINATEMSKPFDKRPIDWIRLSSTQDFIRTLRVVRFPHITDGESAGLIESVQGNFRDGRQQGTWMHEDVALEFARWLSPAFAIWCNDRIKELLKHGITATDNKLEELLANPDLIIGLASQLKTERARNILLESCNQDNVKKIEEMKPKEVFADAVSTSKDCVLVRELASYLKQNGIDIGQNRLFEKLRSLGYLCSRGDSYNKPSQKSLDLGLFEVRKYSRVGSNGTIIIEITPVVTGKGQIYFVNKFLNSNKRPEA